VSWKRMLIKCFVPSLFGIDHLVMENKPKNVKRLQTDRGWR
jgi:hypothetical protein